MAGLTIFPCEIDSQPTRHDPITHYVLVRPDLPVGLLAAQVVHAAGESSGVVPPGTYAVVLAADDARLHSMEATLKDKSVPHAAIREDDELVAIGVKPERRSKLKKLFSSIPLLR